MNIIRQKKNVKKVKKEEKKSENEQPNIEKIEMWNAQNV